MSASPARAPAASPPEPQLARAQPQPALRSGPDPGCPSSNDSRSSLPRHWPDEASSRTSSIARRRPTASWNCFQPRSSAEAGRWWAEREVRCLPVPRSRRCSVHTRRHRRFAQFRGDYRERPPLDCQEFERRKHEDAKSRRSRARISRPPLGFQHSYRTASGVFRSFSRLGPRLALLPVHHGSAHHHRRQRIAGAHGLA